MSDPPTRLLDDPNAPEALRDDLARAKGAPARAYDLEAGFERFSAAIGAVGGAATSGAGGAGAAGTSAALKWLALGFLGGAAVVSGLVALAWPEPEPAPTAPGRGASEVVAPSPAPPSAVEPAPTVAPVVEAPAALPAAPREASVEPPQRAGPAAPGAGGGPAGESGPGDVHTVDPDERYRREIAHTRRLRVLLPSDPGAALREAREGQRLFRGGLFVEDRAAHEVLALSRLGRSAEAARRGGAFLERYPRGPYSEEIRHLVGAPR